MHVLDDAGNNVKDVPTTKDGAGKPSDATGLATYDPLPDGSCQAGIGPLSSALAADYVLPSTTSHTVLVQKGQIAYAGFVLTRKAQLKVKLLRKGSTPAVFGGATVKLTGGPDSPGDGTTAVSDGTVDFTSVFGKLQAGAYTVSATLDAEDAKTHQTSTDFATTPQTVDLAPGEDKTAELEVERKNLVKPRIEVEYLAVLLDQDLASHQDPAEADRIARAAPTFVELSFTEHNADEPATLYTGARRYPGGGVFTCTPAHVKIYTDALCTAELPAGGALDAVQLPPGGKYRLYLRGVTEGKFEARLAARELAAIIDPIEKAAAAPTYRFLQLWTDPAPPAQVEMGVVKLTMTLHAQDAGALAALTVNPDVDPVATYHTALKNLGLPPQLALSTATKIKTGRLLHVQKDDPDAKANHNRAKLTIPKLEGPAAANWPAGTDDYELVLQTTAASGSVAVHAQEFDKDLLPLPHKIKLADLKAAAVDLWVEGASASDQRLDVQLGLGLFSAKPGAGTAGDLHTTEASPATKGNGDVCRFNVVAIKEVKYAFSNLAGKAVIWDDPNKRFYINTEDDPAGRALKSAPPKGRTIKITAELTKPIKDVKIHFMLSPNKDNHEKAHWGAALPLSFKFKDLDRALKAKDKATPDAYLHFSALTDAQGIAQMDDLVLSRFGGDKFRIAAYIDEDAHLAKYIDGHADLSKKKPALTDEFTLWRRVWVQHTRNATSALVSRATTKAGFEAAYVEYLEAPERTYAVATVPGLSTHPAWQFDPAEGIAPQLCVGDHNKAIFDAMFIPESDDMSPKAHLLMCDVQWDPVQGPAQAFSVAAPVTTQNYYDATMYELGVFSPPLVGGTVVAAATWTWDDGANVHTGSLTDADIEVLQTRAATSEVRVSLPAQCAATCACGGGTAIAPTAVRQADVTMQLNAANGPWFGESGVPGRPHCLIVIKPDVNYFNNTILHEIGHLYEAVRTATAWHGLPDHPNQYTDRGGQGSHCSTGATPSLTDFDDAGDAVFENGTCVMYHDGPSIAFCDHCGADLRVRDLSGFFK
ncbi:hypothetical protein GTP81_24470 [Rugamonas sp. FT107W]|uniref:Uncharacterized protein n=1 Tax=Duganella vulcania TaxID=2692166 RepID=A0A845HQX7_9BURK|nr:hypothetical protein [Duganella vulcania]MYN19905.1 hypothetical protein [Duganella vulcania]